MNNNSLELLRLFNEIDRLSTDKPLIIAIEGGSASGKTTLAESLRQKYDCNVIHMDDFFLRPEQRTIERFFEIGGNIDRERFSCEVLQPLKNNEVICYRRFNCSTLLLDEPILIKPKKITVVEGAYSMHPSFDKYYQLSLFLDIDPEYQRKRILVRNSSELAERFFNEWIPFENRYFEGTDIKNKVDMVLLIRE